MSKRICRPSYLTGLVCTLLIALIELTGGDRPNYSDTARTWVPSSAAATLIGANLVDSQAYVMNSGDSLSVTVALTNCVPKSINDISGRINFFDFQGKTLFGVKFERHLEERLEPGQTVNIRVGYHTLWGPAMQGIQFYLPDDATPPIPEIELLNVVGRAKPDEMHAEFLPRTLSYTNGTREEYEP